MAGKSSFTPMLIDIADQTLFLRSFIRNSFKKGFEWEAFSRQSYLIGYKSIGIIALTGFILGFVLTLQSQPTMKQFGAVSFIPGMVSVSVIREIGPVIVALICAGKISSSIGAELGSMNVTEQIDAMEVSGANPMQYLVVTRILACIIMIPLLTIFADVIALFGGFIATNLGDSMGLKLYFYKATAVLEFSDIIPSFIKTILFGFAIGFVGCYKGFNSNRGTESVGLAANSAVVTASVWIIIIDAIVVQVTNALVYS
jgi:phospholipid/cholesterol/gamma-HCH transport system permease protein